MINMIKENRRTYQNIIVDKIDDYFYKHKRYDQRFSLAIGMSDTDVDLTIFDKNNRQTDMFIELEKNLCCEVYDGTNVENGVKASSNALTSFEQHYYAKRIFVGVVCSQDYDTSPQMVNRVFDILEYAFTHNMDNVVVDNASMIRDY